ncbi:N-acetylmuramoyl-L-alanine amidase AmiB [Candidatus Erwinia haradaeae]|uniref:N-acetylmuramoyl-L-alanine amidase n=1 Tax=Candidatus Erwinia haradaeae TaxID=1922217 RepID=A0A803FTW7_9GAMM|nr:N-acetylmuramoyl-L-alanine amidase AmiB [Candidatus Erwinia haradaeae]
MMQDFKFLYFVLFLCFLFSSNVCAVSHFPFFNSKSEAHITLRFSSEPIYTVFMLHQPYRVMLDLSQGPILSTLPSSFNKKHLVKRIRFRSERNNKRTRLVIDLASSASIRVLTGHHKSYYDLVLSISTFDRQRFGLIRHSKSCIHSTMYSQKVNILPYSSPPIFVKIPGNRKKLTGGKNSSHQVVVAIDAGHGGQDPGAIGRGGLKEKNVTIAIAYKLQKLLNSDPMFKGVMTRSGDYFISVLDRSDVACKKKANLLVSIHADSVPNSSVSGASVWVLSNHRIKIEMASRLEHNKNRFPVLGGTEGLLANGQADPSVRQALLDLQFGRVQKVGYDVANKIITQLKSISSLHKNQPMFASLGVLRSPEVPSLLIETGFISNPSEEKLLKSSDYQKKLTKSIYQGLRNYFLFNLSTDRNIKKH